METKSPSSPIAATPQIPNLEEEPSFLLTPSQIETYLQDGVLVVDNVLTQDELNMAKEGMMESLRVRGVESFEVDDEESAMAFQKLSSTNGSGGVLDIFHDDWKLQLVATHPKLFSITQQLWKEGYNHGGRDKESLSEEEQFKWHPYGTVDFETRGYCYIDRIGYRLPTELAQEWGDRIHRRNATSSTITTSKKKKKLRSVQRSLTPHLDCCPDALYENTNKWRPIQCFVSLTDNLQANTGGFEAVLGGFHRTFDQWAQSRNMSAGSGKLAAAPCLGEYTHIRPKEDWEVMKQVCHIPVRAGSAVFWDNRIPHANAYRNDDKSLARAVVYASFLPDIELNRRYVRNQLQAWKRKQPIRDQWNQIPQEKDKDGDEKENLSNEEKKLDSAENESIFSDLGRKLMGIEQWY